MKKIIFCILKVTEETFEILLANFFDAFRTKKNISIKVPWLNNLLGFYSAISENLRNWAELKGTERFLQLKTGTSSKVEWNSEYFFRLNNLMSP